MTREPIRLRFLIFLTVGAGFVVYAMAEGAPVFAALMLALWGMAWPVSLADRGAPLPRPALMLALVAALAYAVLRAVSNTQDLVTAVSRLLIALQLVKLYDRWGRTDRGLILAMSAFLAVGAVLTSNALSLGLAMLGYLPLLMWTTLQHGLARVSEAGGEGDGIGRRPRRAETRDLRRMAAVAALAASGLAVGTFLVVPRGVGEGFLGGIAAAQGLGARSGFNDSVTLGDAGLITESREPVMDVVLRNGSGRNIGSSGRPLLLRGAVLTRYADGRWSGQDSAPALDTALRPGSPLTLSGEEPRTETFTLEVTLRGGRGTHLFTPLRPVSLSVDRRITVAVNREAMEVRTNLDDPLRYTVRFQETGGSVSGMGGEDDEIGSARVRELAVSLLEASGVAVDPGRRDAEADQAAVGALVTRLHREYVYTTEMTAAEAAEDPIEMFLFRTREGHCEYFASGLTAMCRSVGLPSRVVTGYLAVEFDDASGAYLVRESHAHAWVEVRLSDGRWITVDPSPPADLAIVHQPPRGVLASVNRFFDRVSRWWISNVVAFDEERRQAMVGRDPLLIESTLRSAAEDAFMPTRTGGAPIIVIALLRGVVVFAGVSALGIAGVQAWAALAWWRAARREARRADRGDPHAAERRAQRAFYARALRSLRRAGLGKPGWRPILDHAGEVARVDAALGEALAGLGRLYYASRFGRLTLSPAELDHAERLTRRVQERADAVRAARRGR